MAVGSVQRVDIAFSGLAGIAKVALPPRESIAAELHDQQIGNQARMPAIAVRKGMDLGKATVESDGDLIGRVSLLIDPRLGIVEEHAQRRRNLPPIDADVARAGPKATGPAPYVGEHVAVEIPDLAHPIGIGAGDGGPAAPRPWLDRRG
jgi:hypothetical protein